MYTGRDHILLLSIENSRSCKVSNSLALLSVGRSLAWIKGENDDVNCVGIHKMSLTSGHS